MPRKEVLSDIWRTTVEEVARAWCDHARRKRARGLEPVWIDTEEDQARLDQAVRARDLGEVWKVSRAWKQKWLAAIAERE